MALRKSALSSSKFIISSMSQPPELTSNSLSSHPPSSVQPLFSGKDLRDWVSETFKQATEKFQEMIFELQSKFDQIVQKHQELEQKHESFSTRVITAFEKLAEYVDIVAEGVNNQQGAEAFDHRLKLVEESLENLKHDVMLIQFHDLQFAVRIRGLAEDPKENIKQVIAEAFMDVLACGPEIYFELESVFRVNSCVAHQRNLPRDIVIYFTTKWRRNEITQLFYQQRFKILNQDIILLKEIPVKMLKERRNYAFLTQELKKRQIAYRWGIPTGINVTVDSKFYKINSLKEANDFMVLVLQAGCPSISHNVDSAEQLIEASGTVVKEETSGFVGKEQRSRKKSRAARRRKQKKNLLTVRSADSRTADCISFGTSAPVGGA